MAKLLLTVAEMQNKQNWLNIRKIGIGGSEAAAALGLNPWKSQFQLWLEKTGVVEAEDLTNNEFVYWGRCLNKQ